MTQHQYLQSKNSKRIICKIKNDKNKSRQHQATCGRVEEMINKRSVFQYCWEFACNKVGPRDIDVPRSFEAPARTRTSRCGHIYNTAGNPRKKRNRNNRHSRIRPPAAIFISVEPDIRVHNKTHAQWQSRIATLPSTRGKCACSPAAEESAAPDNRRPSCAGSPRRPAQALGGSACSRCACRRCSPHRPEPGAVEEAGETEGTVRWNNSTRGRTEGGGEPKSKP